MKNIEAFFEKYARASLSGKSDEIAACYASNFMVATKNESATFKNDGEFIEWLNQVFDFNKKVGLQKMEVRNIISNPIGKYFLKASVTWGATFLQSPKQE